LSYGRFGRRRSAEIHGGGPYTMPEVIAGRPPAADIVRSERSTLARPCYGRNLLSRSPKTAAAVWEAALLMGRVDAIG